MNFLLSRTGNLEILYLCLGNGWSNGWDIFLVLFCSESPSTSVFLLYIVGCLRISVSGLLGLDMVKLSAKCVKPGSFYIKLML